MLAINPAHTEPRIAPGMLIGNFDRRLYTSRQFVSKVVDITPELAEEFLERVGIIHNASKAYIEQTSATMLKSDWRLTHQGIAFNWEGKVCDGYIRLCAIIRSKTTQTMMVTFGLDPKDYPAIDTGTGRKGRHLLHLAGMNKKETSVGEQAIRLYLRYTAAMKDGRIPPPSKVSAMDVHTFFREHEDFLPVLEDVMGTQQTWAKTLPPAVAVAFVYMTKKKEHPLDVTLGFLKRIGSFAHQGERHPILVLYKTLVDDREKGQRKKEEALAKTIRAYNKWVRKETVSKLYGIIRNGIWEEADTAEDRLFFPALLRYTPQAHRNINTLD